MSVLLETRAVARTFRVGGGMFAVEDELKLSPNRAAADTVAAPPKPEVRRPAPAKAKSAKRINLQPAAGESLARASALGLDTDDAVLFTAMELVFGPEFYSTGDWARRVFLEPVAGTLRDRFQRLVEAAVFRLAEISEAETPARVA